MKIDIEKTKEDYSNYTPCDCDCCKNFSLQIKTIFPELCEYLEKLGVDVTKPHELGWIDMNPFVIDYIFCQYLVLGEVEEDFEKDLNGKIMFKTHCSPSPDTTEQYAILEIDDIIMPNQKALDYVNSTIHSQVKIDKNYNSFLMLHDNFIVEFTDSKIFINHKVYDNSLFTMDFIDNLSSSVFVELSKPKFSFKKIRKINFITLNNDKNLQKQVEKYKKDKNVCRIFSKDQVLFAKNVMHHCVG